MPCNNVPQLEEVLWDDVRTKVHKVNPGLAKIIDELNPGPKFPLIRATYPFGQHILNEGILHIPSKGKVVPITDASVPVKYQKMLGYTGNSMPIGLVLNRSIELFLTVGERIIPFSMMHPGKVFALWSALDITESAHLGRIWSITAGARSLTMLPKISDAGCFKQVKREFHLAATTPKGLSDQWPAFKELAIHPDFATPWQAELLYLPANWVEQKKEIKWKLFRNFLLESVLHDTAFLRNQTVFDFILSCALANKNLKPNPYLTDTIKHLYTIGVGAYPAFIAANDNVAAPVDGLQNVFADIYRLRYVPNFVHSGYFSNSDTKLPCYYSLQSPTVMVFSPKSRKATSKLEDIREIKHVLDGITSYILENSHDMEHTPIYKWIKSIDYSYFHTELDRYGEDIQLTGDIPKKDRNLAKDISKYNELEFCNTSPFLRGCIRIAIK